MVEIRQIFNPGADIFSDFARIQYSALYPHGSYSIRTGRARHQSQIEVPGGFAFSAYNVADMQMVGYIQGSLFSDEEDSAKISAIYVDKNWQKSKWRIGTRLLKAAEDYIKQHGIGEVELTAFENAKEFYIKNNYKDIGNMFKVLG